MRFRTDGWHYADLKAEGYTFEDYFAGRPLAEVEMERQYWDVTFKAERGDVWRIFWRHEVNGAHVDDWVAGYAICCVACGRIHAWTTALNCGQKVKRTYHDVEGKPVEYETCVHQENHTSCWTWTGSAEANTLTASPSLLVVKDRCPWGCGWHGWIKDGEIN